MEGKKSFVNMLHLNCATTELSEEFSSIATPAGFRGITLYPHQAVVVKAILDLENTRVLTLNNHGDARFSAGNRTKLESSAIVLSEPFGSGKTFMILAVILERPIPRAFPSHVNTIYTHMHGMYGITRNRKKGLESLFGTEVTRKFIKPGALIKPNLIVVGSSVLLQWNNVITNHTNLNVLVVGNYYQLKIFYEAFKTRRINNYDIVLLKNGKVTGNFMVDGENPDEIPECRGLISVVSKITGDHCWSRVIYDDFDTINIPINSTAINSLFTIYVSATKKQPPYQRVVKTSYNTIEEALRAQIPLSYVALDDYLFTNFNIRNKPSFVENSTKITTLEAYRYIHDNPDDNYIQLLGAMGGDATEIMEMLNGDAIATAAEAIGMKTNSVADIFQRMLDKKYERYINDNYILETIAAALTKLRELGPHKDGKVHTQAKIEKIRSSLIKRIMPKLKYDSVPLNASITGLNAEYEASKERNGAAINRVIDNIKEGACQVCCLPLEGMDTFIVRCCGLIVCDLCGIKGNDIKVRTMNGELGIYGSCANCKSIINAKSDLIFVDRSFNIETLLNAKGDEEPEEIAPPVQEDAPPEDAPAEVTIRNPKLKCLFDIIRGITPSNRETITPQIKHLLIGRNNVPQTDKTIRKVLVFANYNETLNMVQEFLVERGIEYLRLGGTYAEMDRTVNKFKTTGSVLLINSQQNCAGICFNFATDLCFMHKIHDSAIEAQVAGRLQRMGRTVNGRIHYICYRNERNYI